MDFDWNQLDLLTGGDARVVGWYAVAAAVVLTSVLFRKLVAGLVLWPFLAAIARLWSTTRDQVAEVVRPPLGLVVVALGLYAAGQILAAGGELEAVLHRCMRTLAVLALSWVLSRAVRVVGRTSTVLRGRMGDEVVRWGGRLIGILVWLVGVAAVLELWGVRVAPLLASLGILGVAVALGAQDFFKNLISGFVVLSEKRYKAGDRIQLAGVVDGTVTEVGFRSTRVELFDGAPVSVPNAMLADGALVNYGEVLRRRILMNVGLEYRTRSDQLCRIRDEIKTYLQDSGDFVPAEETTLEVRIDRLSDSSIDILIYCFADTTDWAQWLETKEKLILRIKKIVEEAGSGFAFPSRSIYVERDGVEAEGTPGGVS